MKQSNISEEGFQEMSEAIEKLGEIFKKHGIDYVQVTFNTIIDEAECAFIGEEGETN